MGGDGYALREEAIAEAINRGIEDVAGEVRPLARYAIEILADYPVDTLRPLATAFDYERR